MTMTLREKRHRQCLDTIARLTDLREKAYRRLAILQGRLADERQRLKRLQKRDDAIDAVAATLTPLPEAPAWVKDKDDPSGYAFRQEASPDLRVEAAAIGWEDEPIPGFLQRIKATEEKDRAAAEALKAEQAERKLLKARARIAKMKAKERGDLKRMPLTGKAALKAIRGD